MWEEVLEFKPNTFMSPLFAPNYGVFLALFYLIVFSVCSVILVSRFQSRFRIRDYIEVFFLFYSMLTLCLRSYKSEFCSWPVPTAPLRDINRNIFREYDLGCVDSFNFITNTFPAILVLGLWIWIYFNWNKTSGDRLRKLRLIFLTITLSLAIPLLGMVLIGYLFIST